MPSPARPRVYFAARRSDDTLLLYTALQQAVAHLQGTLFWPKPEDRGIAIDLDDARRSDVIVLDITGPSRGAVYLLGAVEALNKPTLLLSKTIASAPFDISHHRYLIYENFDSVESLRSALIPCLESAIATTARSADTPGPSCRTLFISYAHVDRPYLDRLLVHLQPLQAKGLIDPWDDKRITPGQIWKDEIQKALQLARAALLLVSADFLASEFIVKNELPPLLKLAEDAGTVILPLIIKPCRFARDPNLNRFMAINDPKRPLSGLSEHEREDAYDNAAYAIERALLITLP